MTVVKFPTPPEKAAAKWQPAELQQFLAVSADAIAAGEASRWEIGFIDRKAAVAMAALAQTRQSSGFLRQLYAWRVPDRDDRA